MQKIYQKGFIPYQFHVLIVSMFNKFKFTKNHKSKLRLSSETGAGFTLLEILLVIALIAILAGIVIVAINPAKQTADARNTQRISDVNTILNAIYQYSIDNDGAMPSGISAATDCPGSGISEICQLNGVCTSLVDLAVLTTNEKYLVSIPHDPKDSTTNGTGYNVIKTANNRITVCAPHAELSATIEVSK